MSCLIYLRKAGLLHTAFLLPFTFQMALPLIHIEPRNFTTSEIADLINRGLEIVDLLSNEVEHALVFRSQFPELTFNDCMSLVLAEKQSNCILLTGDQTLRTQATSIGLVVQDILWVSDQIESNRLINFFDLLEGLLKLKKDPLVFLPAGDISNRITRLQKALNVEG